MSSLDYEDDECPVCGGEGFVFDCFDGCCLDADIGCDDCTRTCDCQKRQASPELQQVLADALSASLLDGLGQTKSADCGNSNKQSAQGLSRATGGDA